MASLKQAHEFGIGEGAQKRVVLIFYISSVHSVGPDILQGLQFLTGFYWDRDDESRAFAYRFSKRYNGRAPTQVHAAVYSAVRHYLRAVDAANTRDGLTVMRQMKKMPVEDFFARGAMIRSDGRLMNDMLLVQVKKPADVKREWDLLDVKKVVPAADIMRSVPDGGCAQLDPAP